MLQCAFYTLTQVHRMRLDILLGANYVNPFHKTNNGYVKPTICLAFNMPDNTWCIVEMSFGWVMVSLVMIGMPHVMIGMSVIVRVVVSKLSIF